MLKYKCPKSKAFSWSQYLCIGEKNQIAKKF